MAKATPKHAITLTATLTLPLGVDAWSLTNAADIMATYIRDLKETVSDDMGTVEFDAELNGETFNPEMI